MKVGKERLIALLEDILKGVRNDDSFEGQISYTCMQTGLAPGEFEVSCGYRVGNSEGQGGMRLIPAEPNPSDDVREPPGNAASEASSLPQADKPAVKAPLQSPRGRPGFTRRGILS